MDNKLIFISKGEAYTNSLILANGLGLEPRSLRLLIDKYKGEIKTFGKLSFQMTPLQNSVTGQKTKIYVLNEQQATFILTLLRNTPQVVKFKKLLVKQFFEMREFIQSLAAATEGYGKLSDAVQQFYDDTKPYLFTNEVNMLNKIVLGKTSKEMREMLGLKSSEPIRPHLTLEQIRQLDQLQRADVFLLSTKTEYQQRKEHLTEYYNNICNKQEIGA